VFFSICPTALALYFNTVFYYCICVLLTSGVFNKCTVVQYVCIWTDTLTVCHTVRVSVHIHTYLSMRILHRRFDWCERNNAYCHCNSWWHRSRQTEGVWIRLVTNRPPLTGKPEQLPFTIEVAYWPTLAVGSAAQLAAIHCLNEQTLDPQSNWRHFLHT